jgi:hypothetical protein
MLEIGYQWRDRLASEVNRRRKRTERRLTEGVFQAERAGIKLDSSTRDCESGKAKCKNGHGAPYKW